jgi:hypothetical protein
MTTLFVVCFIAGLGLSVVSFVSGLEHVNIFDNIFHGHSMHMPKMIRHGHARGGRHRGSALNAASITAFLVWFGGGGLVLQRLTPWSVPLVGAGSAVIGLFGGTLLNRVIGALSRRESIAEALTMTGTIARTTIPIRAGDGTGEIVFTHQGTRRVAGARSDDGHAIAKGVEVVVTRYEKGIAYVSTWDELAADSGHELAASARQEGNIHA